MKKQIGLTGRVLRGTTLGASLIASTFIALGALGYIGAAAALIAWSGLTAALGIGIWLFVSDIVNAIDLTSGKKIKFGKDKALRMRTGLGRELRLAIQNRNRSNDGRLRRRERDFEGLELALDSIPGPLFQLTKERYILRANKAAKGLFGGNFEDRDLATVMRSPSLLSAIDDAIEKNIGADIQFTLPAPIERNFFARLEPLDRPARDGTALILALVDLTYIQRADQMRMDFIANASHEIRTPLSALIGFIETLKGPAKDDTEAREKFLLIMENHAKRMSSLVEDLLSLSKIEMNEHNRPEESVKIESVINAACDQLKWLAQRQNVSIDIHTDPSVDGVIGSEDELIQLFSNLISNALKYGKQNSKVTITIGTSSDPRGTLGWQSNEKGAVTVEVKDRGEGIDREHIPRLTERFYRIDTARSRELGGTGLGLAIVKHIVSRHRGVLLIDSEKGIGSTFTIFLQPWEIK